RCWRCNAPSRRRGQPISLSCSARPSWFIRRQDFRSSPSITAQTLSSSTASRRRSTKWPISYCTKRSAIRWARRSGRTEQEGGTMRLENKVALITGAASGMGASMARIFAREGAKVVVADMLDNEGKKIAAEITQANGAAMYQHLDVTSEAEWQAAIAATLAAYGKLDILVNDAG